MCAAEHGHFGVVELLLEFGAAVDQKDEVVKCSHKVYA